jgi:LemA protein
VSWIAVAIVGAVIVAAALLVLAAIVLYNRLVRLRNRVDNAWAQVDVQLQRRHDLIPNLVETVKGYAAHERTTFEEVTTARASAVAARDVEQQAAAENQLTAALRHLFAVAEAYPELRASENFQRLQQELEEAEDKVAVARQLYNDAVLTYSNATQTLPSSVVASAFGFGPREYFEIEERSREAPQVDFTGAPSQAAP